jgi:hypothetical protein
MSTGHPKKVFFDLPTKKKENTEIKIDVAYYYFII